MHYEALDVYEQHFLKILGITQISNLTYATAIATTSQTALQVAIAYHGTMPNNPNLVPISVNLYLQQLITVTTNIPPTIETLAFADPMGDFFQVLELEFPVKSFKKNL